MENTRDLAGAGAVTLLMATLAGVKWNWELTFLFAFASIFLFVAMIVLHIVMQWAMPGDAVPLDDVVSLIKPRWWNLIGIAVASGIVASFQTDGVRNVLPAAIVLAFVMFVVWGMTVTIYNSVRLALFGSSTRSSTEQKTYIALGFAFAAEMALWVFLGVVHFAR